MAMYTSGVAAAFLPNAIGPLIVQPVSHMSVAFQVATVFSTGEVAGLRIPVVSDDPDAAWVAEGAEITPSDATFGETVAAFKKVAGLTIISRELAEDSSPAAASVVGQGLARDIANRIDAAFFGNLASPAPAGLGSVVGFTAVAPGAYANLDPFLTALSVAEQVGATITAWVTDPATALTISKIRTGTGSNATLLQAQGDPTAPTRRMIGGVPLFVSPAVTAGVCWGIAKDRVILALRDDTRLEVDRSAYFSSDRVGVKATMRVGFAFPHPASVVKISV